MRLNKVNGLILFLILLTWSWVFDPRLGGSIMRDGRARAFIFACGLLLSTHLAKKWHWSTGLFYAYAAGQFVWSGMPTYMMPGMITLTATLLFVPVLFEHMKLKAVEDLIIFGALLNTVVAGLNSFGFYWPPLTNPEYQQPIIGMMGQHTLLAPLLVAALCLSASRLKENLGIYGSISIAFLIAILLTKSSMGYISLLAAASALIYLKVNWKALALLLTISFASGYAVNTQWPELSSLSGRQIPWSDAAHILSGKPVDVGEKQLIWPEKSLTGYGLGSWGIVSQKISTARGMNQHWRELHSDILESVFSFGIIGAALLLVAIGFAIRGACANHFHFAIVAALLANALGNYSLQIVPLGQIFAISFYVLIKNKRGQLDS